MRTTKRALLGLALAAAMIPFAATSAQAGGTNPTYKTAKPGNCPSAYLCVYKDINYGTGGIGIGLFKFDNKVWSNTDQAFIVGKDSSWYNNGTGTSYTSVIVYMGNDYTGNSFCLDKGWGNTWDSVANDKGRGNRWISGSC
ncbi:peptidase inhibitor family I36 protein [Streptomyces sp. NPDC091412]|uniref:peptidase inhibitor family I36 protein n=1 Tax=Streptomyces sp. NPDC091412 TaxID=3366002 RepID=UPI00380387FE